MGGGGGQSRRECVVCVSTIAHRNWHITHLWNFLGYWSIVSLDMSLTKGMEFTFTELNGVNFYELSLKLIHTSHTCI